MRPLVRAETSLPNHSHNYKALRGNLETPLQISLTIGIPKWVVEVRRGMSGQGHVAISARRAGMELSGPEETTQLLDLLMPRPERREKVEIMERAGEMAETWRAERVRSSAKA